MPFDMMDDNFGSGGGDGRGQLSTDFFRVVIQNPTNDKGLNEALFTHAVATIRDVMGAGLRDHAFLDNIMAPELFSPDINVNGERPVATMGMKLDSLLELSNARHMLPKISQTLRQTLEGRYDCAVLSQIDRRGDQATNGHIDYNLHIKIHEDSPNLMV